MDFFGRWESILLLLLYSYTIREKTVQKFAGGAYEEKILAFVPTVLDLFDITPDFLRCYPSNACMDLIAGRACSKTGLILTIVRIAVLFWVASFMMFGAVVPFCVPAPIDVCVFFLPSYWMGKSVYEGKPIVMLLSVLAAVIWILIVKRKYDRKM